MGPLPGPTKSLRGKIMLNSIWRLLASLSFLASVAVVGVTPLAPAAAAQPAKEKTIVVPVTGMSCVSCAASVKRAVGKMRGVSAVQVNLASRSVAVRYSPAAVSPLLIVRTIDGLGYRAGRPIEVK